MRGYMFRNKWLALLFVAMTLAGVTKLVGTEEKGGTLQETAGTIADQRDQFDRFGGDTASEAPAPEYVAPSDEDLIDPATGIDPLPSMTFSPEEGSPDPPEEVAPPDEVVTVSQYDEGPAGQAQ